jgi:hypothetical protein
MSWYDNFVFFLSLSSVKTMDVFSSIISVFTIGANGLQLQEVGDFTLNVNAENQTLINHKTVCGALNRQFLVGAVSGSVL